jgi:site-specific recombinase XerD
MPLSAVWRGKGADHLDGAFAPSTVKSYLTDVRLFVEWCEARGLEGLPAEVDTVCAFLDEEAKALCPLSVRRRLYAIRKVHRLLRLPDRTWDEAISITLRRIRRAKLNPPKQAKGMTRDYLQPASKCSRTIRGGCATGR